MGYIITRKIPRSERDAQISEELEKLGVSTISESQGGFGLFHQSIRPVAAGMVIAGPAITVSSLEGDNLILHAAIEIADRGDVIVVSCEGLNNYGTFGELMSTMSIAKGIKGLITESSIRDSKRIRELKFPVWSNGIYSLGTTKKAPGWVNVTIACANQVVNPGDFVVADDDGVVVVKRENVNAVIAAARLRQENESKYRKEFEKGKTSIDVFNLRKNLEEAGVEYRD